MDPKPLRRQVEHFTSNLDQRNSQFRKIAKFFNGSDLTEDERLANFYLVKKG